MATVKRAAPPDVVNNGTIVKMNESDMQTIQKGSNGWTWMAEQVSVPSPRDPDPDPKKPYVMGSGTQYEHLVLPVK